MFYLTHKMRKINKKGQAWSLDALVATLIFFSGIAILFFYAVNYTNQITSPLDDLLSQGNLASELLLSNDNLGLLTDNKMDQIKIDAFAVADHDTKRRGLGIKDNFYFTMPGLTPSTNIGVLPPINVKNSIKIERIVIYNNKPVKFELFIWR